MCDLPVVRCSNIFCALRHLWQVRCRNTFAQSIGTLSGGGGGRGISVRKRQIQLREMAEKSCENCGKLRENCGKIAAQLRSHNQSCQSLKEQHGCMGGSECFCVSSNMVHRGPVLGLWTPVGEACVLVRGHPLTPVCNGWPWSDDADCDGATLPVVK